MVLADAILVFYNSLSYKHCERAQQCQIGNMHYVVFMFRATAITFPY